MANFHEITCTKNTYKIDSIVLPQDAQGNDIEDATYCFVKLTKDGVPEFNRMIISKDDQRSYREGTELELIRWTMPIIPVKTRNKRGELKVIRNVSGFAKDKAAAEESATRAAQRLYDDAEEVADSAEARKIARENMSFCNFVARADFIAGLDNA